MIHVKGEDQVTDKIEPQANKKVKRKNKSKARARERARKEGRKRKKRSVEEWRGGEWKGEGKKVEVQRMDFCS